MKGTQCRLFAPHGETPGIVYFEYIESFIPQELETMWYYHAKDIRVSKQECTPNAREANRRCGVVFPKLNRNFAALMFEFSQDTKPPPEGKRLFRYGKAGRESSATFSFTTITLEWKCYFESFEWLFFLNHSFSKPKWYSGQNRVPQLCCFSIWGW